MKFTESPLAVARGVVYGALVLSHWLIATGVTVKNRPTPSARVVSALRERPAASSRVAPVAVGRAAPPSTTAIQGTGLERRGFDFINARRRAAGMEPLVWGSELYRVAQLHSEDMARRRFFGHVSPNGLDTYGRARLYGIWGWRDLGENIARNFSYKDPVASAVEGWMRSATHRDNILNARFTHSGLGIARGADGSIYFTQVFATR